MRRKASQTLKALGGSILSVLLVGLFVMFALREKGEVLKLKEIVAGAHLPYIVLGVFVTGIYIFVHSQIYKSCLRAMKKDLPTAYSIELFLKRYFVSAFIPTGFSLSQFTFSKELDEHGIAPLESHLASMIYLLMGALAYIALLFPTLLALIVTHRLTRPEFYGGIFVMVTTLVVVVEFFSLFRGQGLAYRIVKRFLPDLPAFLDSWQNKKISQSALWQAFFYALVVELIGATLLWITFAALNIQASFFVAIVGYVITILVLTFSPIFQGIGLVEISLVFGLTQFGLSNPEAVTATLLFRLFQLWIPFFVGFGLYVRHRTKKVIENLPELTLSQ